VSFFFGCRSASCSIFLDRFSFGALWISEYGDPDDASVFKVIRTYSPLHNVNADENVVYPATLLTTADTDTRVVPAHSLKFAATLQGIVLPFSFYEPDPRTDCVRHEGEKRSNPNPLLLRIYRDTGHGLGKTTKMIVNEAVERLAFIKLANIV
jgi:prolyl oligopeptidase